MKVCILEEMNLLNGIFKMKMEMKLFNDDFIKLEMKNDYSNFSIPHRYIYNTSLLDRVGCFSKDSVTESRRVISNH